MEKQMPVLLFIFKYFIKFIYFFMKLLPTKENRVLMLSRQDNKPSIDFEYIINEIHHKYPEKEIIVLTKRMDEKTPRDLIEKTLKMR